jgi:hypothetical protein
LRVAEGLNSCANTSDGTITACSGRGACAYSATYGRDLCTCRYYFDPSTNCETTTFETFALYRGLLAFPIVRRFSRKWKFPCPSVSYLPLTTLLSLDRYHPFWMFSRSAWRRNRARLPKEKNSRGVDSACSPREARPLDPLPQYAPIRPFPNYFS